MKRIKNFVKNTFKNYPKEQRDELIESITEMLVEKVEDLVEHGYSLDDAIDKTVLEFGNVEDYEVVSPTKKRFKMKKLAHYKNDVMFSIVSIIIIIGMLAYVNYISTDIMWFVIPSLALLFWPLSTIYRYLNRKGSEGDKDE